MALIQAHQGFVLDGYAEIKEKSHWWNRYKYVRKPISLFCGVCIICDESNVEEIIEQKITEKLKNSTGWGKNFEGWTSYRKYCKPGEDDDFPDGKEFELNIEYIRDWKMEKIIKELDGTQFAILCEELGISAGEAFTRP